jgi:hypothetical protein
MYVSVGEKTRCLLNKDKAEKDILQEKVKKPTNTHNTLHFHLLKDFIFCAHFICHADTMGVRSTFSIVLFAILFSNLVIAQSNIRLL